MKRTLCARRAMIRFWREMGGGMEEEWGTYTSNMVIAKHALACVQ